MRTISGMKIQSQVVNGSQGGFKTRLEGFRSAPGSSRRPQKAYGEAQRGSQKTPKRLPDGAQGEQREQSENVFHEAPPFSHMFLFFFRFILASIC